MKRILNQILSWSGKKKINSYKLLSVMDHLGCYFFARLCLGKNDCEVFTASPSFLPTVKSKSFALRTGILSF